MYSIPIASGLQDSMYVYLREKWKESQNIDE